MKASRKPAACFICVIHKAQIPHPTGNQSYNWKPCRGSTTPPLSKGESKGVSMRRKKSVDPLNLGTSPRHAGTRLTPPNLERNHAFNWDVCTVFLAVGYGSASRQLLRTAFTAGSFLSLSLNMIFPQAQHSAFELGLAMVDK